MVEQGGELLVAKLGEARHEARLPPLSIEEHEDEVAPALRGPKEGGRRLEARVAEGPCAVTELGQPAEWAVEAAVPITKLGRLLAVEDALRRAVDSAAAARSRTIET